MKKCYRENDNKQVYSVLQTHDLNKCCNILKELIDTIKKFNMLMSIVIQKW